MKNHMQSHCFHFQPTYIAIHFMSWQPFYLNSITGNQRTHVFKSISIQDIISDEPTHAVLLNYMVDYDWLFSECPQLLKIPVIIMHGHRNEGREDELILPNVACSAVDMRPETFGTHHSKIIMLIYSTGMRLCIGTANLLQQDFENKAQGFYVQDFPLKSASSFTKEESEFERDLVNYFKEIKTYCRTVGAIFQQNFVAKLSLYDFASAEVVLVASVPGRHHTRGIPKWGHLRLKSILNSRSPSRLGASSSSSSAEDESVDSFTLVSQVSSISSMGKDEKYLIELEKSFLSGPTRYDRRPTSSFSVMKLIWPTVELVRMSKEGYVAGGSLPCDSKHIFDDRTPSMKIGFRRRMHPYQYCLPDCDRATPHIKTYCAYRLLSGTTIDRSPDSAESKGVSVSACGEPVVIVLSDSDSDSSETQLSTSNSRRRKASNQVESEPLESARKVPRKEFDNAVEVRKSEFLVNRPHESFVELDWFLLTSANLSQAAWGVSQRGDSELYIKSFELGVLFLPERLKTHRRLFSCTPDHPILGLQRPVTTDATSSPTTSNPVVRFIAASGQLYAPTRNQVSDKTSHGQDSASTSSLTSVSPFMRHAESLSDQFYDIRFPIPYSVISPLYDISCDEPWTWNLPHDKPDKFGRRYGE